MTDIMSVWLDMPGSSKGQWISPELHAELREAYESLEASNRIRGDELARLREQEPVVWTNFSDPFAYIIQHLNSSPYDMTMDECVQKVKELRDLYAAPPAQPAEPVPLTDEQIEKIAVENEAFGFGRVDEKGITTHGFEPEGLRDFVRAVVEAAVKAERERCAKVCLDMQEGWPSDDHLACAAAIRKGE